MLCCAGYPSSSLMDTTMPVAAVGNTPDDGAVSLLPYLSSLYNSGKYISQSYVINKLFTCCARVCVCVCVAKPFMDIVDMVDWWCF